MLLKNVTISSFCVLTIVFASTCRFAYAQGNTVSGLYFKNMAAISPAMTGTDNYVDIHSIYRSQWIGTKDSPYAYQVGLYTRLKRDKKNFGHPKGWQTFGKTKIGLGGYLLLNNRAALREIEGIANMAVHIPINRTTYFSLGLSAGIVNNRLNVSRLTIENQNDPSYLTYISDGSSNLGFKTNAGVGLYSKNFYVAYGLHGLSNLLLGGNENVNSDFKQKIHSFVAAVKLPVSSAFFIMPNGHFQVRPTEEDFLDLGARAILERINVWAGSSYRTNQTLIFMGGLEVPKTILNFGYSYEHRLNSLNGYRGFSEVLVGIKLK